MGVNDEILQEYVETLKWYRMNEDFSKIGQLEVYKLLKAANYFYNRMLAAEQAAKNFAYAARRKDEDLK